MSDPNAIDVAARRLALALDALQGAMARKREVDTGGDAVAMQLHVLGTDRARLAAELDAATAHARKLEDTSREVVRRIDVAMDTIQTLLNEHDR